MIRRKDFMTTGLYFEDERRIDHRVSTLGSTSQQRRQGRVQRQVMRRTMQQAQRLTVTGGKAKWGSLSPGVCFRAARRSYPDALLVVSDILTEAQVRADAGQVGMARRLDGLAERIALHSGFDELVHLVWAYGSHS